MNAETSWYATDRKDNAAATATKAAESNTKQVVTSVHASFSGTATKTLIIKQGSTDKVTLDVVNSLTLDGLELEFDSGSAVSAVLASSTTSGVYGSVLMCGYSK